MLNNSKTLTHKLANSHTDNLTKLSHRNNKGKGERERERKDRKERMPFVGPIKYVQPLASNCNIFRNYFHSRSVIGKRRYYITSRPTSIRNSIKQRSFPQKMRPQHSNTHANPHTSLCVSMYCYIFRHGRCKCTTARFRGLTDW